MPPSAHPASSTIVLPPITAFDYPSRNAPAPAPFAPSPYTYTAYQPHLHSLPAPPPPNQPGHGGFTTTRPIWPGQSYVPHPGRIAPPMTADPNLLLAQTVDRANFKEVKRRTKTGCQTCRKRRIKCDETKPACRNCLKSKRVCLGYDPTPQGAANSSPSLHQPLPRSHTTEQQSYRPPVGQPEPYNFHRTPSLSSRTSSAATDNSFAPPEFSSPANSTLPPIRADSPPRMEDTSGADDGETGRYQSSESDQTIRRAKRCTIDELCTVGSTQRPVLPPLQPNQIPDLHRIKAIYATAFAPGLDKLLETLWFSKYGFQYLVNFEGFLAQILAYIQLISDHQQGHGTDAALASQEARVTWALLGLCVRPQAQTPHLRCLKGRLHAISVMLTGDGVPPNGTTVYEDESDPYIDIIAETESSRESHAPSVLEKQLRKRSHEFWRAVGRIVNASWNHLVRTQKSPEELDAVDNEIEAALGDCQARLDGRENRDVVYSVLLMRYLSDKWTSEVEVDVEMEGDAPLGNRQIAHQGLEERIGVIKEARKRWNIARRLLEGEAGGRSTSLVLGVVAGMAVRAWA